MTASKNRKGFTLLEVVIAMSIAALSLTTLFTVQGNMVRQNARAANAWNALAALKNLLYQQYQKTPKPEDKETRFETTIEDRKLVYHLRMVAEKSKLKDMKNFRLVDEQARWNFFGREENLSFVGARLVPEEMPKPSYAEAPAGMGEQEKK